jgi:hypothetical protein
MSKNSFYTFFVLEPEVEVFHGSSTKVNSCINSTNVKFVSTIKVKLEMVAYARRSHIPSCHRRSWDAPSILSKTPGLAH